LEPEEFHQSVPTTVPLCGDVVSVTGQLVDAFAKNKWAYSKNTPWWSAINDKVETNRKTVKAMMNDTSVPLNYYAALSTVHRMIPENSIIVNEGANTMDIGRNVLLNRLPRHRLDAGTYGTMGVGLGFATAAALHCEAEGKGERVICVQGDSAFGFGGMEIETLFRYKLPVISVIINNNGIYGGVDSSTWTDMRDGAPLGMSTPPNCLVPNCHYEKLAEMCGGQGFFCETVEQLESAMTKALQIKDKPTIINVMIATNAQRKQQDFDWLTRAKL
jgi:2-hydroxyacyl-CoA lyase 1